MDHSIVTPAKQLGMDVVAVGVETSGQIAILQIHGAQFGNGLPLFEGSPVAEAEVFILAQYPSNAQGWPDDLGRRRTGLHSRALCPCQNSSTNADT